MDYLHTKQNEDISTFYILKERSRRSILNLGYDFIEFKRSFKKEVYRLKYRLPSFNLYI
jgi:hypothetical protein